MGIPAVVVVDSRNIYHQAENALGARAHPGVQGVIDAFQPYGFDVFRVHVGLALPRRADRGELAEQQKINLAFKQRIESHPQGRVLLGELHVAEVSDGRKVRRKVEEKQVDVACAVDICRYVSHIANNRHSALEAIIVCSQDTDLNPAYAYAQEMNVPCFVAGFERLERRGHRHVMLTERAFRLIAGVGSNRLAGHALRRAIALAVRDSKAFDWRVGEWDNHRKGYVVTRSNGLRGLVSERDARQLATGQTVRMHAVGVDFGRQRNEFPLVRVGPRPRPGKRDHLYVERRVRRRYSLHEITIDPVRGRTRLPYAAGGVQRGSTVLVDCSEESRPQVIGPTSPLPRLELCEAAPFMVEARESRTPTQSAGRLGAKWVTMIHAADPPIRRGWYYACVLVDGTDARRPTVQVISSHVFRTTEG